VSEPSPIWQGPPLSERQRRLLGIIMTYREAHGYSPSVRDLVTLTGWHTISVVHYHLRRLEQAGLITRDPKIARSIRITRGDTCRIAS
jgi:repressor LexA